MLKPSMKRKTIFSYPDTLKDGDFSMSVNLNLIFSCGAKRKTLFNLDKVEKSYNSKQMI